MVLNQAARRAARRAARERRDAQRDVEVVAASLAREFDRPIEAAMVLASTLRRNQRERFDDLLNAINTPPTLNSVTLSRAGVTLYEGGDPGEMLRIMQVGDVIENAHGARVMYTGGATPEGFHSLPLPTVPMEPVPTEPVPESFVPFSGDAHYLYNDTNVDVAFTPFSGDGNRLDDDTAELDMMD